MLEAKYRVHRIPQKPMKYDFLKNENTRVEIESTRKKCNISINIYFLCMSNMSLNSQYKALSRDGSAI